LQGDKQFAKPFNFGPQGEMTVLEVLQTAKEVWNDITWEIDNTPTHPAMVYLLKIDSTESYKHLGWKPRWSMKYSVARAIRWYKEYYETGKILTMEDIEDYEGGNI
jgi:CDP-glucose 4,6-dehydratase